MSSVFRRWSGARGSGRIERTVFFGAVILFLTFLSRYVLGPEAGLQYWLWLLCPALFLVYPRGAEGTLVALIFTAIFGFVFVSLLPDPFGIAPAWQIALAPDYVRAIEFVSKGGALGLLPAVVYFFYARIEQARDAQRRSLQETSLIFDHVTQGLASVEANGEIGSESSRPLAHLLNDSNPAGRNILEFFAADPEQRRQAAALLEQTGGGLGLEAAPAAQLDDVPFERAPGDMRRLAFRFAPLRGDEATGRVLVSVEDRTAELRLADELDARVRSERVRVQKLYEIANCDPELFLRFVRSARETLHELRRTALSAETAAPPPEDARDSLLRQLQTLRISADAAGLSIGARAIAELEGALGAWNAPAALEAAADAKDGASAGSAATGREAVRGALDVVLAELSDSNAVYEKLLDLRENLSRADAAANSLAGGAERAADLQRLASELADLVRRESASLGKRCDFAFRQELDAKRLEALPDALFRRLRGFAVQLTQNSLVHGVERPEERRAADKPGAGRIALRLEARDDAVILSCEDDGRGLDEEQIRAKAVDRGLIRPEEAAALSRSETLRLIFRSGLSTAEEVRESAGRGVGMDIVRAWTAELGGRIRLRSETGRFARFAVELPIFDCDAKDEA